MESTFEPIFDEYGNPTRETYDWFRMREYEDDPKVVIDTLRKCWRSRKDVYYKEPGIWTFIINHVTVNENLVYELVSSMFWHNWRKASIYIPGRCLIVATKEAREELDSEVERIIDWGSGKIEE